MKGIVMVRKYILAAMNICLFFLLMVLLFVGVIKVEIFDNGQMLFLILGFLVCFFGLLLAYFNKNKSIYNIGVFVSILLNVVLAFHIVELNNKFDYINDIFKNEYKYGSYYVYVQRKTTTYSDITKLEGRKVGIVNEESFKIRDSLKNVVHLECRAYNNMNEIENAILNGEIQSFILSEEKASEVNENDNRIMKKVRIIYTDKYKDSR